SSRSTGHVHHKRAGGKGEGGPSSKTCPKCASHFLQRPSDSCRSWCRPRFWTFCSAMGAQKPGQPVADSNLVSELNRTFPTAHAAVDTRILNIVMITAKCALGACASSHCELPRCQFATSTRPRSSRLCRQ